MGRRPLNPFYMSPQEVKRLSEIEDDVVFVNRLAIYKENSDTINIEVTASNRLVQLNVDEVNELIRILQKKATR